MASAIKHYSVNKLHIKVSDNGERSVYELPLKTETDVSNVLSGFTFHLNCKTNNSYILVGPKTDKTKNNKRYSSTGWELLEGCSPIFYRESLGGFVVSKKYRNRLIEYGAKEN